VGVDRDAIAFLGFLALLGPGLGDVGVDRLGRGLRLFLLAVLLTGGFALLLVAGGARGDSRAVGRPRVDDRDVILPDGA